MVLLWKWLFLSKNIIIKLGLMAAASAANAKIPRKILGQWPGLTLMISNKDMNEIKII